MIPMNNLGTISGRSRIVRCGSSLAGILLGAVNATANAAQANQGAPEKGLVGFIVVIVIGLVIVGFGAYAIWLGIREQTEAEKAKYRRDSLAAYGYVKPPIPIYKSAIAVVVGIVILLGGIIFLIFVPGSAKKAPVASLPRVDVSVAEPTMRSVASEPAVAFESQIEPPLETPPKPSVDKITASSPAIPSEKVEETRSRGDAMPKVEEPDAPNESQASIDREPAASPKPLAGVTRYKIGIPLPDGAMIVAPETPLSPGMKLGAVWGRKWNYVTVDRVHDDGTVDVTWDGWRTKYRMVREDLAIAKDVALAQQTRDAVSVDGASGVGVNGNRERLWNDASGKFSVLATYVDSKGGFVLLRKSNGDEVSIPIIKLSKPDRIMILKLAKQKSLQNDDS